MPSSGQPSKCHPMGHFLSTHQNKAFILEEVATDTNQELLVGIPGLSDKAVMAFLTSKQSW